MLAPDGVSCQPELVSDQEDPIDSGRRRPLPSFEGVSLSVGAFLAGLEQKILHGRPPAIVVVEEHDRSEQLSDGLGLVQTDEPVERPEPPDTTGAVV
jgi:hypothetical protein